MAKDLIRMLKTSHNCKILLLTATPMKNRADNFIDLLNILRVCNDPNNKTISKYDIFEYK